jgi:aspartate aminotransferase-like enzyme
MNNLVIKTSEIVTVEEISRVFEEDPEIEFVTIVNGKTPENPV